MLENVLHLRGQARASDTDTKGVTAGRKFYCAVYKLDVNGLPVADTSAKQCSMQLTRHAGTCAEVGWIQRSSKPTGRLRCLLTRIAGSENRATAGVIRSEAASNLMSPRQSNYARAAALRHGRTCLTIRAHSAVHSWSTVLRRMSLNTMRVNGEEQGESRMSATTAGLS